MSAKFNDLHDIERQDKNLATGYTDIGKVKDFAMVKSEKERYFDPETGAHFDFEDICIKL